MPVTRIPVDVVMERVPLVNRWVSENGSLRPSWRSVRPPWASR